MSRSDARNFVPPMCRVQVGGTKVFPFGSGPLHSLKGSSSRSGPYVVETEVREGRKSHIYVPLRFPCSLCLERRKNRNHRIYYDNTPRSRNVGPLDSRLSVEEGLGRHTGVRSMEGKRFDRRDAHLTIVTGKDPTTLRRRRRLHPPPVRALTPSVPTLPLWSHPIPSTQERDFTGYPVDPTPGRVPPGPRRLVPVLPGPTGKST